MIDEVEKAAKFLMWWKDPAIFFRDVYRQEPYPYQAVFLRKMAEFPKRVLLMSAGGTGKTKSLGAAAIWFAAVASKFMKTPLSVIIISGSREQAKFLYDYAKEAFVDNPILASEVDGEPLVSITRLKSGGIVKAVPNSLKAIQGEHRDIVIIDEAVLSGNFIIADAQRIIAQSKNDMIVLSGTPMNEEGGEKFIEMWEEESKYPEWLRFHWSASECPNITTEKFLEARKNLPDDMFNIFWEGKPAPKIGTLISLPKLKNASKDIPIAQYDPNGGHVIAGVDWGYRDPTAVVIVQYPKPENLEKERIRVLFSDAWSLEKFTNVHDKIAELYKQYHVSIVYTDAADVGENQRLLDRGLNVIPIAFNQSKVQMQTKLKLFFHQDRMLVPEENHDLVSELRVYTWDTAKGEDLVDALMLCFNYDGTASQYFWNIS